MTAIHVAMGYWTLFKNVMIKILILVTAVAFFVMLSQDIYVMEVAPQRAMCVAIA